MKRRTVTNNRNKGRSRGRPVVKSEPDQQLYTGIPKSLFKKMEKNWRKGGFPDRRAYLITLIKNDDCARRLRE